MASPRLTRQLGPAPARSCPTTVLARTALSAVAVVGMGNLAIHLASARCRRTSRVHADASRPDLAAIRSFAIVDDRVWRGGAPDDAGYRALAAAGVTTIIDLRAERSARVPHELLDELGLRWVAIPVRDGQAPTAAQAVGSVDAIASSPGVTYVHCGAGVGRTGAVVGAYRVAGGVPWRTAIRANLSIGPPSLEQLAFVARSMPGEAPRSPNPALVWLSRALDSPRRGWHVVGSRR